MPSETKVSVGGRRCRPFLLRVMVFSPEAGFKFDIEVQLACSASNEEIWKLLFHLSKKTEDKFVEIVSVEFVAGDPNEIEKVAAITDEGLKRPQVRAFRDRVFPLTRAMEDGHAPTPTENAAIHDAMREALIAA